MIGTYVRWHFLPESSICGAKKNKEDIAAIRLCVVSSIFSQPALFRGIIPQGIPILYVEHIYEHGIRNLNRQRLQSTMSYDHEVQSFRRSRSGLCW